MVFPMEDSDNRSLHSRDQVWGAISALSEKHAATDARIGALEASVNSGFSGLNSAVQRIEQRINQPAPRPNYIAWVGGMLAVLALFGGYSQLIVQPMQQQIAQNYERLDDNINQRERIAVLESKGEELQRRISDIDTHGSRRWTTREISDAQ